MKKVLLLGVLSFYNFCSNAQVPELWGMTHAVRTSCFGSIFKINGDGTGFTTCFNLYGTSGICPEGNLLQADNGLLYGVTEDGGVLYNEGGTLFSYDPFNYSFTVLFNFKSNNGQNPICNIIQASDRKLYGVTQFGGNHTCCIGGVVFSYNIVSNQYSVLHSFDNATGEWPLGSLFQSSNGKLYGTTSLGSSGTCNINHQYYGCGNIFELDISNNSYSGLFDFANNPQTGAWCTFSEFGSGQLYGTTFSHILKFDISSNVYSPVFNLLDSLGLRITRNKLLLATNGLLYGTTQAGGNNDKGGIFSFNPVNNTGNKLFDFNDSTGYSPKGSLMQASDGKLYGMAQSGGDSAFGVIFQFDPITNVYKKIHSFEKAIGGSPTGGLIEIKRTLYSATLSETISLQLSPNPATNTIAINIDENMIGCTVTVSDITGRKMAAVQLQTLNTKLETAYLANGVYFVTVVDNKGRSGTKKLVVSH